MNKDNYLEYIRILHGRVSSQAKNNGFTTWALLIGMIYLIWNSIPQLNILRNNLDALKVVLIQYSHVHVFLIGGIPLLSNSARSPIKNFDYRISVRSISSYVTFFTTIFVILILPTYATHYVLHSDIALNKIQTYQLTINKWFLLILSVSTLIILALVTVYEKFTGYPFPLLLPTRQPKSVSVIKALLVILFIELLAGNLYALIDNYFQTSTIKLTEVTTLAFNLSLFSFALILLLRRQSAQITLSNLERLERDIIIHRIEETEIKQRLEEEFLEHELGEWLKLKLSEVKQKADSLLQQSQEADEFCTDYSELGQGLRYEKFGRMHEYEDNLKTKFNEYIEKFNRLWKWLDFAMQIPTIKTDSYLIEILSKTTKDLNEIRKEVCDKVESAIGKIEALKK